MLSNIINTTAAIVTLLTTAGILFHDTQIDRATAVALTLPAATAISYAAVDSSIKSSESHTHVERASAPSHISGVRAMIPRVQPRDDDRRYLQTKKLYFSGGGDSVSLWPSV
jgi:hypothetical protein